MLYGREREQEVFTGLLYRARTGHGAAVDLTGEPGIGKTALMDEFAAAASGASVLRATSVETEAEFGYATLHQLLLPVLNRIDRLPTPQSDALQIVFGLAAGPAPERFAVGLATLSLLSDLASDEAVVCLVDDVHWTDHLSAGVLEFVGRRLDTEPIVLVLASRTGERSAVTFSGAVDMPLGALDRAAATRLLVERRGVRLSPAQQEVALDATAGNPLAIIELPSDAIRAGVSPAAPVPMAHTLRAAFLARVRRHSRPVQRLLLLIAAAGQVRRGILELAAAEFEAAPVAELARLGELVRSETELIAFRHPLIRSAVYYDSTASDRRDAHRVLAGAMQSAAMDVERSAWHLGQAVDGPDDVVAGQLDRAAGRVEVSVATSAALLARAGELSTPGPRRSRRYLRSATGWWNSGDFDRAMLMLELMDREGRPEESLRRDAVWLRASMELQTGMPGDAVAMLRSLLPTMAEAEPLQAVSLLMLFGEAGFHANLPVEWGHVGSIAEKLPISGERAADTLVLLLRGACRARTGRPHGLTSREKDLAELLTDPVMLNWASGLLWAMGDRERGRRLNRVAVQRARDTGAVGLLVWALQRGVIDDIARGRFRAAEAAASEGHRLADEIGQRNVSCWHRSSLAVLAASRGQEREARDLAGEVLAEAIPRRLAIVVAAAKRALGLLDLTAGHANSALNHFRPAYDSVQPEMLSIYTPDWVEAAVRAHRPDLAVDALEPFRRSAAGAPERSAVAARCEALLAGPEDAEAAFRRALALHRSDEQPMETARTQLLFGEYLRRHRRRAEARRPLQSALETFEALGAAGWADRARAELRAAGKAVAPSVKSPGAGSLTSQEVRIVHAVAEGSTNREIADQLFLSTRTIDYHLSKIFKKLGVRTRSELIRATLSRPDIS
ncbi:helix-turn-helix transcriptional regulator [Nocardia wallacei]|uniref:helix-turn-helix transcriptional regulator n=1 Tax=Nocardia wallacei TaxID=480035 RepID=UPI002453C48F|nr:helix-turn-helix transcriptional regulator [Nocardia wallacei]